jgi:alkanesulfonate monooxygenase SsuD/methylene tetrahydromethanopterin reductase-like flavin-dependent oxidoreductase (luciferase family)
VRLAIGVIVLPQRRPVLLAKRLATIDVLWKGRLIVGVGVGYVEPELRALGASLNDRSARTDEYLAAMRAVWDAPTPAFAGRFVSFADVLQRPPPIQQPTGNGQPARRRGQDCRPTTCRTPVPSHQPRQ